MLNGDVIFRGVFNCPIDTLDKILLVNRTDIDSFHTCISIRKYLYANSFHANEHLYVTSMEQGFCFVLGSISLHWSAMGNRCSFCMQTVCIYRVAE